MRLALLVALAALMAPAEAARCQARSGPHTTALLVSRVAAGENRGRTLAHDYVVFEWLGPIGFVEGRIDERRELPLLPGAVPAHSGVAAFVQNRRTAEVLQALLLPACPG
jgi:hypothetical protein